MTRILKGNKSNYYIIKTDKRPTKVIKRNLQLKGFDYVTGSFFARDTTVRYGPGVTMLLLYEETGHP